ncbi:phage tail length tape measure family protein, partial [Tabrizicola fusiformis]|uniref:phage tail length tape measure family protein n=1 Tax=Tabrizicola sp. SY72 TaxID=2741673 RepID=UPI001573E52E|nr:phage tail length tape measure family protein [Tabrizicola sp. SY72]
MAGNLRVSMLFEADTGRARSAIAGLRGETDQLGAAVAKAGQGARTGGAGISAAGEASEATAGDFLRAVTAAQSLDAVVGKLGASMSRIGPSTFLGTLAALGDASLGIDEIAADFRQATDEARLYQSVLDQVRAKYDPLFAASQRYELELREIAEAERLGALSALGAAQARERAAQSMTPVIRQVGQTAAASNAHLANLGFQANDIFMMMAAGQNPMMLAIQQGTQVSQVFGMMRKEGQALGPAIRSALMGMVSPMSLVTMGVIALGAVAVQSLMSMGSEAKSTEDTISDMTGSVRKLGEATSRTAADIVADFGQINPALADMQRSLSALAQVRALQDLRAGLKALKDDVGGGLLSTGPGDVARLLGTDIYRRGFAGKILTAPVAGFRQSLESLQTAEGPAAQVAIVRDLKKQLEEAAGGIGSMNAAQLVYYDSLLATESAIERIVAEQAKMQRQAIDLARATGTENTRMGGPTIADIVKPRDPGKGFQDARDLLAAGREEVELARLKLAYGEQSAEVRAEEARQANAAVEAKIRELGIGRDSLQAQQMRGQEAVRQALAEAARIAAARTAADQMLAQHQQEAGIVELTARWGADSLEVAYARVSAERQVYEAQLAAQGISGKLADDLMDAWDAARGVAAINMAAGIAAAAGQAMLLAQNLGISLRNAAAIANVGLTVSDGSVVKPGGTPAKPGGLSFGGVGSVGNLGFSGGLTFGDNPGSGSSVSTPTAGASGVGKGGGGGGAKAEANALAELIQREREQIEALRVLDPVQAEILKNHEALKGATDAEKQSVADLIAERMRL